MTKFRTLDLAVEYYQLGKKIKLSGPLRDQFLRSASSVSLNLAEGNAKSSRKDRLRIFEIAYGSFRESQAILKLEGVEKPELFTVGDQLGASLYKLTRALMASKKERLLK